MALSLRRFLILRSWREQVPKIVRALERLGLKGYLAGSVARGNYDCSSDFDLVIVVNRKLSKKEALELKMMIEEALEEEGVPPYFPVEIHLVTPDELDKYPERVPLEELL